MKKFFLVVLTVFLCEAGLIAQNATSSPVATETIQPSQSVDANEAARKTENSLEGANQKFQTPEPTPIRIAAGTPIEVEVAYTVSSLDIKPGEVLTFRVLIPVVIDGVTAIEKDAVVTARVTLAKRGGHWGKAGRLAWAMEDVVAVDNTRVRLDPVTHSRDEALWSLEKKSPAGKTADRQLGRGSVKGTSHKKEVATRTVIAAAIFPPLAPLALMHGFKRGENAVLPEGKRYVVIVRHETSLSGARKN